jgi:hypothetical protein
LKKIVWILILTGLAALLMPLTVSAEAVPFTIEPGKVIGYNIKAGSKFTFPITINNNSDTVKTFRVASRLPDILSEGYEASDGKWVSIPENIEIQPGSSKTIDVYVTAPGKSSETWIGIVEDKTGLRYELITKVMINVSSFGISSLGIVKYSQPGEEKQILSVRDPIILGSAILVILVSIVVTVVLVRRNRKKSLNIP